MLSVSGLLFMATDVKFSFKTNLSKYKMNKIFTSTKWPADIVKKKKSQWSQWWYVNNNSLDIKSIGPRC